MLFKKIGKVSLSTAISSIILMDLKLPDTKELYIVLSCPNISRRRENLVDYRKLSIINSSRRMQEPKVVSIKNIIE